ncbi:MAG: Gfo/Idh/MocA family oxidoreductase [Caldilineaceae bacterium]|nr:Gfo/Idh/MocA family oxidoreductase [Caldilineaceae bacterium]
MAELRIALLGSGYMGRTYAECISKYNSRAQLAAVSGGTRAPGLAAEYGVDYVESYETLVTRPDVDAILIATPHINHRDQVILAAQHGKHVLVEKPMATTVADCTRMIDACRAAGVRLEVIQTLRFRGVPARAKQLIDRGAIGKVWMIRGQSLVRTYIVDKSSWAAQPENGGAFLDMGVHNFDIMRFWTGSEVHRVFSHVTTYGDVDAPGMSAMTQLTMANGVAVQQWMSFEIPTSHMTGSQHIYHIVGETGMIEVDGYGKVSVAKGDQVELIWEQPTFDFINRPLDPIRLEAFFTQTQAFVDDVLDGRTATVSGEEGRAAVAIVEAAWQSAQTGQAVTLGGA